MMNFRSESGFAFKLCTEAAPGLCFLLHYSESIRMLVARQLVGWSAAGAAVGVAGKDMQVESSRTQIFFPTALTSSMM
jgi:hypothetical protein